jgi:hypothetical protein
MSLQLGPTGSDGLIRNNQERFTTTKSDKVAPAGFIQAY